jgi:N-acetylglucosaminyldiphosphoundecaprenol N-acetyl-beta-D-mannosaminyltransferase
MLTESHNPSRQLDLVVGRPATPPSEPPGFDIVRIWGLPLARLTYAETLDQVDRLVQRSQPAFFVTANLNYAMLTDRHPGLRAANDQAAFLVADGMPLVWYSRLLGQPLAERVAGADLIDLLFQRAAERGYRVFLLGGAGNVGRQVANIARKRYPALKIVGVEAPKLSDLSPEEHRALVARIRRAQPDLLLVAFGQPKGELWLAEHCRGLGVPACVQLGASFDFLAGRTRRAPRWMQRVGAEWLYRAGCEPRRMIPRYLQNAAFLVKAVARDVISSRFRRR